MSTASSPEICTVRLSRNSQWTTSVLLRPVCTPDLYRAALLPAWAVLSDAVCQDGSGTGGNPGLQLRRPQHSVTHPTQGSGCHICEMWKHGELPTEGPPHQGPGLFRNVPKAGGMERACPSSVAWTYLCSKRRTDCSFCSTMVRIIIPTLPGRL